MGDRVALIPLMTSQTDRRRNFAATREKQLSAQLLLNERACRTIPALMPAAAVAAGFSTGRDERCQAKNGGGDESEKCSTFEHCGISLAGPAIFGRPQ